MNERSKRPRFHSIKSRLTLASLILLPMVCGLLGWSLDQANNSSLLNNKQHQLQLHAYALMASAEFDNDQLWLPPVMTEDRFNQPSSDLVAFVLTESNTEPVWSSASLSGKKVQAHWQPENIDIGEVRFGTLQGPQKPYFYFHYTVAWETEEGAVVPFQFVVMEQQDTYLNQISAYRNTLWLWLSAIGLLLIGTQSLILSWGLRPLHNITQDLKTVQQGQSANLKGQYPKELKGVAESINQLIAHENTQRERYRNTLSDLAHSIKNPVSIISGAVEQLLQKQNKEALLDIQDQNQRINQIISYQLSRSVGQSAAPFRQSIPVEHCFHNIKSALDKVYADKAMEVERLLTPNTMFRGDEGDLMELLGNLMDNAYKYGKKQIRVELKPLNDQLYFSVEDDGPGISESEQKTLLRRGRRADTTQAGQGIGLAVVEDIVQSYKGTLSMQYSNLGGLKIAVTL